MHILFNFYTAALGVMAILMDRQKWWFGQYLAPSHGGHPVLFSIVLVLGANVWKLQDWKKVLIVLSTQTLRSSSVQLENF